MAASNGSKRVALITGSSRGIGLGIARRLASDGINIVVNGVRPEADAAAALDELRSPGAEVIYARGNVADASDRAAMLQLIRERFGRLDVLINNAGMTSPGRKDILTAADEETFDLVMGVNLKGPFFLTQAVARWMVEQRTTVPDFKPVVVNVSSVSAEFVSTNRGDYCLSKAATRMATWLWAVRLAEFGIPVYEIQPGVIRSDMTAGVTEKYDRLIAEGLTLEPRWGEPDDIGRAVAALVRGDIPYATGQVLKIDGGMTIHTL